jgi:hypothetical protein
MKRFLSFAILGPLIGLLTGLLILAPALSYLAGDPIGDMFDAAEALPVFLPLAYAIGLLPALATAAFDGYVGGRGARHRWAWSAVFGFAAAFLPLATSFWMGFLHGPYVLAFGIVGAVPAAACSWIAGKWIGDDSTKISD